MPHSALRNYIREFLEYCEIEKNQSPLTIRNYQHYLGRFADYAEKFGITNPEKISLDTSRSYRLALNRMTDEHGKSLKLITQNYHVIALRAFLKYLTKRDIQTLAPEKIELAKNPSRQVHALEVDEIKRMLTAVNQTDVELIRLRDKAIMLLLFSSGVRISELVSLKKNQINFKQGEFTVRGKGDKVRLVFISPDCKQAIENYLKKRTDNHPGLFVSHSSIGNTTTKEIEAQGFSLRGATSRGKAAGLTARSVQRMVHKYALLAGITQNVTPHIFRHSFATDLLQNGADIRSVQTLLGHASITTTQIYTHITNQGLREIHKKFHNKK